MGWTPACFSTLVGRLFMCWFPTSELYVIFFISFCFVSFHSWVFSFSFYLSWLISAKMWAVWKLKDWKWHSHGNSIAFYLSQIYLSFPYVCGIFFVFELTHDFFLPFISFHLIHIFDSIWHWGNGTNYCNDAMEKKEIDIWWRKKWKGKIGISLLVSKQVSK